MLLCLFALLFNLEASGLRITKFVESAAEAGKVTGRHLAEQRGAYGIQNDGASQTQHYQRNVASKTKPSGHSWEVAAHSEVAGHVRDQETQHKRPDSTWHDQTDFPWYDRANSHSKANSHSQASAARYDRADSARHDRADSAWQGTTTALPMPFQGKDPLLMHTDSVLGLVDDVYSLCRQSAEFKKEGLPDLTLQELRKQFELPSFPYHPYATLLPVYFITNSTTREPRFRTSFKSFSPSISRVEAVFPDDSGEQVKDLLDDPETIVNMTNTSLGGGDQWKKALGCLLSHLMAIREAYRSGSYAAIILEDDALPYYPAWNSSLEGFLAMLPASWEAVQLQWSADPSTTFDNKSGTSQSPFVRGTSWGTTAYAIHRRGMERLLLKLWNRTTDKFTLLPLVSKCDKVSADDCLLGFTGFPAAKRVVHGVNWYPDPADPDNETATQAALSETFKATPPLLLHASFTTLMHVRNFCQDLVFLAQRRSWREREESRVLLFLPVGTSRTFAAADQLRKTVTSLTSRGYSPFLAYDNANEEAATPSARKLKLFWQAWQTYGSAWAARYDYIWALDEDVGLGGVELPDVEREALKANALLVAPTLDDLSPSWQDPLRLLQWPDPDCRLRYTHYVEAVAPMLRPSTWALIFREYAKINGTGFQGIDRVWCAFLESQKRNEAHACALLDRITVVTRGVASEPRSWGNHAASYIRRGAASDVSGSLGDALTSSECMP